MADTPKGMGGGGGFTPDANCYRRGGSCACGGGVCGKEQRSATLSSPSTAPEVDVRHEFERWMSQRGESAVYIGDGLYSTGAVCDQAEAFAAGVELACAALASRPAEVDGLLSAEQVFRLFGLPDPAGLAADYSVEKALQLLREARAVLETWKDVAPAVSLCADIDKVLAGGGR